MNFKTLALATVAAVGVSGAASAATLGLTLGNGTAVPFGTGSYSTSVGCTDTTKCYDPQGAEAAGLTRNIAVFDSLTGYPPGGPTISAGSSIRVTFLGKEAGATNAAFSVAGGSITNNLANIGSSFTTIVGAGVLDFNFSSLLGTFAGSNGFKGTAAIGFSRVFNDGKSIYAFFDDSGARDDRDFDDMVVRIDVVPVPAAGLLLLGGLGAFAAVKRRKKAA